jgi:protein O-mannosyl-transferase
MKQNDTIFHQFTVTKMRFAPRLARHDAAWLALVFCGLAVIYGAGLANLPVFDDAYFTEGAIAKRYATVEAAPRMLSYGTFLWLQSLVGAGLWKQRLLNVGLHLGVVLALWGFYREILRSVVAPPPDPGEPALPYRDSPALGFALGFFALNPMAVYAVAYLIQRSIVMATLFVVCGLWVFARALREGRPWMHAAAVACYALALASKETAVFAPLAALPVYILVARPSRKRLAALLAAAAVMLAVAAAILWKPLSVYLAAPFDEFSRVYLSQLAALDPAAPRRALPLSIENEMWLFFAYGVRWFLPVSDWMSISMRPPFPVTWLTFPHVLGAAGFIAAVAGGAWLLLRTRDWRALVGCCVLMAAILFGTEFITVWVQDPFVLYRSYLWAIGIPGLVLLLVHGTPPRVLLVVGLAVGVLLTWQSTERVLSLATPETAWSDAIDKLPKDPRAVGRWFPYLNRGAYYVDRDQLELAMRDFEQSSALGDLGLGAFNLGSVLNAKGQPKQALALFDKAQAGGYDLHDLPFQRALAHASLGRTEDAFKYFGIALEFAQPSPIREVAQLGLGRAAVQIGRPDEAIKALSALLGKEPRNNEARYLLAMAHVMKSQPEAALRVLAPAEEAGAIHYARAVAYHGLGRKAEAQREIEAAIRIGPANPALQQWQARINAMR